MKEIAMHAHVILAHPEPQSYNAHLAATARTTLEAQGWSVSISDLYQLDFDPRERASHYAERIAPQRFDVQSEQRNASSGGTIPSDVASEIALLEKADLVILQYPMWWHLPPAMLKGWFDRVWLPGVVFRIGPGAIEPLLVNIRRISVVTTYGSPPWLLWYIGWPDFKVMNRGLRRLCAKDCRLDWLYLTRMDQRQRPELERFLGRVDGFFAEWRA
jgi:NAD(P)H dehydrogenase (quinone)